MQLLLNGLIAGSLAALIAAGLALVYGVLGVFNMALGQLALTGGYATWWLHNSMGLPLAVSIIGGIAIGGAVTWLLFLLTVGPFYRRHRFLPLVTTIAASMILDGLLLLLFGESPKAVIPSAARFLAVAGVRFSTEQLILVAATAAGLLILAWILHATRFGRRIRASVQHPDAARSIGIASGTLHQTLFVASGMLAAAGGIFIGIDQNLTPTLAFPLTIKAYAAVIAGGRGNLWGAVVMGYAIALLEQFAVGIRWFGLFTIPAGYQSTVALLVIIIFLLWKPSGLFASPSRCA